MFAYQHAYGLVPAHAAGEVVVCHRCDEASCQNPTHLQLATRAANVQDYLTRRHRVGWPLADTRGAAGRAAATQTAGDPHAGQPTLFDDPGPAGSGRLRRTWRRARVSW